jgi:cytidylate kinase
MAEQVPFVVTISRQMGSGGAEIGQMLAKRLDWACLDREIVTRAAEILAVPAETLSQREESVPKFWQTLTRLGSYISRDAYIPPQAAYSPTQKELFAAQSEVIRNAARDRSLVIIGRCGASVLAGRPNVLSVFLHADLAFRARRVSDLYHVAEPTALKMISQCDSNRAAYHQTFAGENWTDATRYDLTIHTGHCGLDQAVELILAQVRHSGAKVRED